MSIKSRRSGKNRRYTLTKSKIISIDARGKRCPRPIIELAKTRRETTIGTIIEVVADDLAFESDVRAWCETTGNKILELEKNGNAVSVRIEINELK